MKFKFNFFSKFNPQPAAWIHTDPLAYLSNYGSVKGRKSWGVQRPWKLEKKYGARLVHSQPLVWFDQNFCISRYNTNLKKITHIKEDKNIYFT